jgi:RNA-directed DNA polymerase
VQSLSPLLANIALHGMTNALAEYKTLNSGRVITTRDGVKYSKRGENIGQRAVVRYADDFVVFCESKEDAEQSVGILAGWLRARGLQLSPEKTRIVHLSEGFNFLGFNIRHYKAPRTSGSGWKLLIKPSNESVQKMRNKMRQKWLSLRGANVVAVLTALNPIIRGWANYFRRGVAAQIFKKLDHWMYKREIRYVKQTHPRQPKCWQQAKYWGKLNRNREDH